MIQTRLWRALIAAGFPLICIVVFSLLMIVWGLLELPPADEVYSTLIALYRKHGLVIVAVAALIEGLVMINVYLPGSAVVLVAVAASRGDPLFGVAIVATASAAFLLAAQVNYALGYYGFHTLVARFGGNRWLETTGAWYRTHGALVLLPSYVHPSVGSFMSVTCGIVRLRWRRFLPLVALAIVLWNSFWGTLAYLLADPVRHVATNPYAVIVGLVVWAVAAGAYGAFRNPEAEASHAAR